ncbi:MFS transporter [Arthrobacter ginkgonis]|uniref:MFS transporter n=1 Tax=Arthrobacter ginkgonis TaxID=1630594 RepID=A0ABP7BQK8_9MICC
MSLSSPKAPGATAPDQPVQTGFIHSLRALKHRDFAIFWIGAILTNTGKFITTLAVPMVIYQMTGSATMVGLVATFQYVPGVIMGPIGGSLADKLNRRKVIIFAQIGMMLSTFAMFLAWNAGVREPYAILWLVALIAVFNGMTLPGWAAFINDLVPRSDLMSGVTLNSLQGNISKAMGPAIAGAIIASVGVNWAFLCSALSFLFVLTALFLLRTVPISFSSHVQGNILKQNIDAGAYIWLKKGIFVAILLSVLIGLLGNPIYSLTVVLGKDVYGVDAGGVGALSLALGLGAIFSAPLVAGLHDRLKMSQMIGGSVVVYGLGLTVIGLTDSFVVAMVALVAIGVAALGALASINTAIQLMVATHFRGRVLGLRHVVYTLSFPVGGLLTGWLADLHGVQTSILACGIVMIVVPIILYAVPGSVRMVRLNDPHDDQIERLEASRAA